MIKLRFTSLKYVLAVKKFVKASKHGLRTPREEIVFTALVSVCTAENSLPLPNF